MNVYRARTLAGWQKFARPYAPEFILNVLVVLSDVISYPVPPDRGRSHETHSNGKRCGACGFGLVSRASGGLGSHCPAQLRGSARQRAGGADERRGEKPCGIEELSDAAPFRFQKAVPRTKEKRRGEAPKGAPARVMDRLFP